MRRRLIAAVAALALLGAGTVVLLAYVRGADARALAGVRTVEVLVADRPVPAGTPAADLPGLVRTDLVPVKAALPGRVTDLAELAGQVATVDLLAGEQLLLARFAAPADLGTPGTVEVPAGLQEVSVLLEPQRAVGGRLAAGDTVGVLVSQSGDAGGQTHAVLHRVLVTQVQGAPAPADPAQSGDPATASAGTALPSTSLLVTLAVTAAQAEAVVFGAEHGSLWLSLEPEGAAVDGTSVLDSATVYEKDLG
ncbi:RcpC/CpaB family pilus assembly protein [Geodermatophilus sp. YIM 151500]|uniref:Flp pilus assembly protein CpaB n=1 Tax=Geodermatophilus sp. YIM 151500 TaxID=2984531 RepID=UPI0021E38A97|nr:RcpC/CpaB family pilus assembly protein [Geodermatophilus sp. YIM 151500]MCV2490001.1 RcpC/CpaB family pilus assembly protein [Geodermatophilus sp. YIM 151500]